MTQLRKDSQETRRQLLDAAEQLFAEQGIDNVNLLHIGRAAGQKNRNAPQYHFGDKAGLINAVLDRHTDAINHQRGHMLEQLAQRGSHSLQDLVEVFVLPVAAHVANHPNSKAFLLINAQMLTTPGFAELGAKRADAMPEVIRLSKLLARAMTPTTPAKRQARLALIQSMLHHGLATFRTLNPGRRQDAFVEALCAGMVAVLSHPA